MKKKRSIFKKIFVGIMAGLVACTMCLTVSADTTTAADESLKSYIVNGGNKNSEQTKVTQKTYKLDGGGTVKYSDLVKGTESTGYVEENTFGQLKGTEKQKFLEDLNNSANIAVSNEAEVSEDTKSTWLTNLQNCDGIGSQLMASLLQNTKPDYVAANRIYEPFSGVVGTCLALGAILLMALLGIVMVLDLSYIGIPIFRNFCDGDGGNGKESKPKFISFEAVSSVSTAESSQGGGGQDGASNKTAIGLYLKKRIIMLVILGVCLLYLIQGQIYTLVSWLLDLLSGFIGF